MKRAIIAIFLISLVPISTSGQMPNPEIQWTADWDTEDEVAIMQLDEDTYSFELILQFWINNNRLTPIEVGFETEFEYSDFEVDDPGQVTVEGNSNKTFELKISGSGMSADGYLYPADIIIDTITLRFIELFAGQAVDSSREIEMDLEFSKIYNLVVKYEDSGDISSDAQMTMKSGTTKKINLRASNYGNTDDAVTKTSISVSRCPQLAYSFEQSRDLPIVVPPGVYTDDGTPGILLGELEVSTTTSHPTKECILEFTIYPESDSVSSYATLTIDVESVENQIDEPEDNTGDTTNTESKDLDVESSSLPAISTFLCTVTVLFSALIRRK